MIDNDETAAASVGLSPTRHKIAAAALAGAIAGIGGVLFAHYMTFIDPRNFGVMLGVHSLAYGMIGGLGTFFGPLIGVVIDIGLLESLRVFSGLPDDRVRQSGRPDSHLSPPRHSRREDGAPDLHLGPRPGSGRGSPPRSEGFG